MKKLFIFIACAVMLLSSAAAVSAKELKSSGAMLDFAEKIGIINTEIDAADDYVTREIFAVYIARMLGIDETQESNTRYFIDLENNAFSQRAVNLLAERGIIAVSEDRYFRPGEVISYDEAVKMLVCAAGYDIYAEYKGGYPRGYLSVAESLKIKCNVRDKNRIKVTEAAELIYRTLVAPVCTIDTLSGINTDYGAEDSMLAKQFDIQWQEGTVYKIAGQSVKSDGALPADKAEISSHIYNVSPDLDAEEFLGSYVKYFYRTDADAEEIIFISDEVKSTEDIEIDIDLLEDFTGNEISYYKSYESSKTVSAKLRNTVVVYNGIYLGEDIRTVISTLNKGSITIKDSDSDGNYDIVIIKDYRNFLVGSVDTVNNKLFNKLTAEPKEISCDDFDTVVLKDEKGNRLELADIAKQSVLSAAVSKDNVSYAEIVVSSTEFSGIISAVDNDDFSPYAVINSEQYKVDKSYYEEFSSSIRLGGTYYFKTDMFGRIAYVFSEGTRSYKVGYVRKLGDDMENCILRLLTEEHTLESVKIAEKVKIDGKSYKTLEEIHAALDIALGVGDNLIKNHLICYVLNDEGDISQIDTLAMNTAYENDTNSITAVYEQDNTEKVFSYAGAIGNTSRTFGRAAIITPKTTVFFLPGGVESPELEDCYVGAYTNILKENIRYTGNAYKFSKLNAYADVVLARYDYADLNGNTNGSKFAFMIDKISVGLNDDDEVVQYVRGYENGVSKTLTAASDVDLEGLKRGDVVRFEYDVNSRISPNGVVEKLYDSDEEHPNWGIDIETGCMLKEAASYTQLFQASFGNVVRVTDNCIFWAAEGYADIVDSVEINSLNIAVYNSEEGTVSAGTINDIYDAESRGVKCSKIMYITRDNVGRCIYIFN